MMRRVRMLALGLGLAVLFSVLFTSAAKATDMFTRKWECVSHLQKRGYSFEDAYRRCVEMLYPLHPTEVRSNRGYYHRAPSDARVPRENSSLGPESIGASRTYPQEEHFFPKQEEDWSDVTGL